MMYMPLVSVKWVSALLQKPLRKFACLFVLLLSQVLGQCIDAVPAADAVNCPSSNLSPCCGGLWWQWNMALTGPRQVLWSWHRGDSLPSPPHFHTMRMWQDGTIWQSFEWCEILSVLFFFSFLVFEPSCCFALFSSKAWRHEVSALWLVGPWAQNKRSNTLLEGRLQGKLYCWQNSVGSGLFADGFYGNWTWCVVSCK